MKSKNETLSPKLIDDFIQSGGTITICKPKPAPIRRSSNHKILTRDQMKSAIGQRRSLSQIARLELP